MRWDGGYPRLPPPLTGGEAIRTWRGSIGATLVTHNVRELSRVPGLSLVDWQA